MQSSISRGKRSHPSPINTTGQKGKKEMFLLHKYHNSLNDFFNFLRCHMPNGIRKGDLYPDQKMTVKLSAKNMITKSSYS